MASKKKIVIFTIFMASGGAEKVISMMLPELVKKHEVNLVLFYDVFHFHVPEDVKIVILNKKRKDSIIAKIFNFPLFIYKYISFIKHNQISVSISFLTRPNLINGLMKMFIPETKIIMSERGFPSINYKSHKLRYALYQLLIPKLYNKADIVFSNSERINEDLERNFGVTADKTVLYNPIFIKEPKVHQDNEIFRIISVGSLRPIKNHALIIKAVDGIKNMKLRLLGAGKERKNLEDLVSDLGINGKVFFEGQVKDVDLYLQGSDCFVLSSNSEGFPNPLLEPMAIGLPVISTNCLSGPLEILNNNKEIKIDHGEFYMAEYGLLINVDDEKGLNKALIYFQNNFKERVRFGDLAYERAKFYNIEAFMDSFSNLVES